jgi:hypothetical protein
MLMLTLMFMVDLPLWMQTHQFMMVNSTCVMLGPPLPERHLVISYNFGK